MTVQDPPIIRIDTSMVDSSQSLIPTPTPYLGEKDANLEEDKRRQSDVSDMTKISSQPTISPVQALKQALEEETPGILDNTPFGVSPKQLSLINHEAPSMYILQELGGIEGVVDKLRTDLQTGLSADEDFAVREAVYGKNVIPDKKTTSLFKLMLLALSDKMLILLSIAAIVSFALGMYQSFGTPPEYDRQGNRVPKVDWIEGVAILVAVVVVVSVGALNDWQKELQFAKLNKQKDDREVKVIRSGKTINMSVFDIVAGDVMVIEPGDMVPVDGLFIQGHGVRCDESAATGESNALGKMPARDAIVALEKLGPNPTPKALEKLDPIILSGSKVLEGFGTFLVVAVGPNSAHGKTMMDLRSDDSSEVTPLQGKLNVIAETIAKWGGGASVLLFVILTLRFLGELPDNHNTPAQKGEQFLNYLITSVTLIAVAVPEGLPLAVTLALAFATKRMLKDNNLVRVLKSCETMGNATTICSDKTGTLTQNKMTVVEGSVGVDARFTAFESKAAAGDGLYGVQAEKPLPMADIKSTMPQNIQDLVLQSIASNTTAFEDETSDEVFVGSKTETAMLNFARNFLGMGSLSSERSNMVIRQLFPFDSAKKCMGVVLTIRTVDGGEKFRLYVKGASEIVLAQAAEAVVVDFSAKEKSAPVITDEDGVSFEVLDKERKSAVDQLITSYAEKSLRTIGMVYRDFPQWPPAGITPHEEEAHNVKEFSDVFKEMKWIGLVGIVDPLRPGVSEAVEDCQRAGVVVRMVTGDNVITAKAIATDCGIYTGGVVMTGPEFRAMDPTARDAMIPKLQVLARSSPQDKRLLVQRLRRMGETVAVTGDGTNDAPALTMADVGFAMGIAGTEVAKEASDIILMDDNFSSIVKAMLWGRAVNDAVKKFLQFQVTVNITAVLLTFITAIQSSEGQSVLRAVQLLWVNLIMDTFAALALATDPPTRSLLDRKPSPKSEGLITVTMWKMMICQAAFQLVATFVLHFKGAAIWGVDPEDNRRLEQIDALVFNAFVWMQFFNMFVNRRLDNKLNIFEGITRNMFFIMIACIMCGGQVLIMFVGGNAFSIVRQTGVQWAVAIVVGFLSIPMGIFIRLCIPDSFAYKIYKPFGFVFRWLWHKLVAGILFLWPFKSKKKKLDEEIAANADDTAEIYTPGGTHFVGNRNRYEWNPAIEQVREDLLFLKRIRGGRVNELKFKPRKIYHEWRARSASATPVPGSPMPASPTMPRASMADSRRRGSSLGALAMVPSIVGGAVAGWSPIERPVDVTLPDGSGPDGLLSPASAGRRSPSFSSSEKN
ncbi:hypothetical protein V1512DRAFT_260523 [Lipomyces arxii]|uniref:uncharacterized protein n=1 Tax=Lipomyces arxii TaxID=56418 RepID=UPI0034CF0631